MTAQPAWRRLTLDVPEAEAEAASALLATVSGRPVALEQRAGSHTVSVSAYLRRARARAAVKRLRTRLVSLGRDGILARAAIRHARVEQRDWSNAWKGHYRPFRLARNLYVVPSWERGYRPPRGADVLRLDPGMAFGTGLHATTKLAVRLALNVAARSLNAPSNAARVIDAGCGSGIVGIALAMQGACVYAFDNDPVAVAAARQNFQRNRLRAAQIVLADRVPPPFPKAALMIANISAETLQAMAPQLVSKIASGGALVTSGLTDRGRLETLFHFAKAGLEFVEERRSGEWFAYRHVKP